MSVEQIGLGARNIDFGTGADFIKTSRLLHQQLAVVYSLVSHFDDGLRPKMDVIRLLDPEDDGVHRGLIVVSGGIQRVPRRLHRPFAFPKIVKSKVEIELAGKQI